MSNWQIVLQPTTSAGFSEEFSPIENNTTTVICAGSNDELLSGSETAVIQVKNPFSGKIIISIVSTKLPHYENKTSTRLHHSSHCHTIG